MAGQKGPELQSGQHALVMGLAKSGEAVARLLIKHGVHVVVNDRQSPDEMEDNVIAQLEALGADVVCGGHPLSLLSDKLDFIVKNPGIPYSVPLLVEAMNRGIPIYTEIEVASWLTHAPFYAITGSNGKTTTTTLVGEILAHAGQNPMVAGNIGRVLSGVIEQVGDEQPVVLEVSSFQLMGTVYFHPRIAALLNLYSAHLDYHGSMEDYADAKWRMFQNMNENDIAVLNYDQEYIRKRAASLRTEKVWFSRKSADIPEGVCVDDGKIYVVKDGGRHAVLPLSSLALKGVHNLENALAATAITVWAGASIQDVEYVLTRFRGVEHRTEFVRSVQGVDFYNDSKATNSQAALGALRGFSEKIVWIAGGLDRGDDFQEMAEDIRGRVKAAVLLGQSAEALQKVCRAVGVETIQRVATIQEAVRVAYQHASPGDVVLLSPACASWDMFRSFEERGSMFKDAVHRL